LHFQPAASPCPEKVTTLTRLYRHRSFASTSRSTAINGLDDLRGWTLKGVVQPFIKIFCVRLSCRRVPTPPCLALTIANAIRLRVFQTAFTLKEIAASWPYMVETSRATGGGDVPAFEWHVIDEERDFVVEGIRITPLNGLSSCAKACSTLTDFFADMFPSTCPQSTMVASSPQSRRRARRRRHPSRSSPTTASASSSTRTSSISPTFPSSRLPSGTSCF
jgi:hypothetical protein